MAGYRDKRIRIADGIHRDKYSIDVRVTESNLQKTKRFPFGTPLEEMQLWQKQMIAELAKRAMEGKPAPSATPVAQPGTLADVVQNYLKQIEGSPRYMADRSNIRAWVKLFGHLKLKAITTAMINETYAAWQRDGFSNQTLQHRRRVFEEVWLLEIGPDTPSPTKGARRLKLAKPHPVPVPNEVIIAVDRKLRASAPAVLYAFFRVLATTGQRPCQVNRAQRADIDLHKRTWIVTAAKGAAAHTLQLNDEMVAAWKLFIEVDAFGKDSPNYRCKLMRQCGWPKGIRPYNLRHSVAFAVMENGGDISDVQAILGHSDPATTLRAYYTHQPKRLRAVVDRINGRFTDPAPAPAPSPRLRVASRRSA